MADDPINQQKFREDVIAAAAANDGESFMDPGSMGQDFKMPSVDEVWKMIQQMEGISDEEKESLREGLYNPHSGSAEDFLKRYAQGAVSHSKGEYLTFFAMMAIILIVFGKLMFGRISQ